MHPQAKRTFLPNSGGVCTRRTGPAVSDSVRSRAAEAGSAGHSSSVQIDPDGMLSADERSSFRSIVQEYDDVFDPNYRGYNGNVGPFEAAVNLRPVEPRQRKGHLPQYARNQLVELQNKFDELESVEVFVRPENIPITELSLWPAATVVPDCSSLLAPLDGSTAGRQSNDRVEWTDTLRETFKRAQDKLHSNRTIAQQRPEDELWIVTDGSVKECVIAAPMCAMQKDKQKLAGFSSAKLGGRRVTWLPCEIEALSIATGIIHFSPHIVQLNHKASVLTASHAYKHTRRCLAANSPSAHAYRHSCPSSASVRHLSGSANVISDFTSRNAATCTDRHCQICTFMRRMEDSVMQHITTADITSGKYALPFSSRSAWLAFQSECPDMRRTNVHLRQGTQPSKKLTNAKDVKRFLNVATVAQDGLLVVCRIDPFGHARDHRRSPTCSQRLDHCPTCPVRSPVHPPTETSEAPICVCTRPRQGY